MTNEIEQALHEKLCAFILGEASDEVRAEVEKALAESADLRAEHERIEKTIGIVKAAMTESESLPPSAAAEILADARRPRVLPWHAHPAFRLAAGFAVVALAGIIGYRLIQTRRAELRGQANLLAVEIPKPSAERKFARQDEPAVPAAAQEPPQLAYTDGKAPEAGAAANMTLPSALPVDSAGSGLADATRIESNTNAGEAPLTVSSLDRIDANDREADAAEKEPVRVLAKDEVQRLRAVGYASSTESSAANNRPAPPPIAGSAPVIRPVFAGIPNSSPTRAQGPASGAGAAGGPSSSGPTGRVAGIDDFFMGNRIGKDGSSAREAPEVRLGLKGMGYIGGDEEGEVLGRDLSVIDQLRRLDPPDREQWIEEECHRILRGCRRRPSERPRDMFFRFWGDNPFELAVLDPQSTFSVDVDTASYALARRYLNEGHIPAKAQVRTEEFINYFKADVPAPAQGVFAIHTDLAPSRFSSDKQRWMLRVVVRGKEVTKQDRKPLNLTFVIDVSGSMREQNRLEMVKHAIRLLVTELGGGDNIAIVAFSNDARTVLPMTSVRNRSAIETALFPLQPENSTNSESGLKLGYATALSSINPEAQNRVVFLSDGVANVGETDPAKLSETIKPIREKGIYLNTIGVGMNNHNDTLLEQLADKGDGVCSYIDTPDEAKKVIVEGFTGAFETIARDVKVQVEFDPAQVERYRLLGYENRAIADKDFRNDKIDAGEVGAGHQVTALYEIERTAGASEKPLATVRLRWKAPRIVNAPTANEEATEIAEPVLASRRTTFEGAGPGYRRAVIVAQFAEFLRRSVHARGDSLDDLMLEAEKLEKETHDPELGELVVLLHKSKQLILDALPPCDDLCRTIDDVRKNELLRCEHELLAKDLNTKSLADLEKQNAELEIRIRELLRRKLEQKAK